MEIRKLLEGAYDLHVHTGPDVMNRKLDDLDMAERMSMAGMKGFAIKSHYFCTAERARLAQKSYPKVNPIGAITLNNAVGGLNATAVDMAGRDGAKVVWMPTFDSANEQAFFRGGNYTKKPFWAKLQEELIAKGKVTASISILEDGNLKAELHDIIDAVKEHHMILASGHLGKEEVFTLVKAAREQNVKTVITHPNFPSTFYTKEEQKQLADMGAYMEHCFTTPNTNKVAWETVYEQIRYVGPQHCILSTDLGQPTAPFPDEGLMDFAQRLLDNGFSEEEIRTMSVHNPTQLVED
ncbi:DUF6282 family protein [Alicyclobacillus sp. SO9]|uniref:DUF6282 family protein n=1 Tax=Alicyclobacillus sp. SO9 TaxID=2665646 RepID=UPI0018E822EF|nr:DUF6282 family protein [Alicyclobacillus sp. SO9]QQE77614.1 cytosolic protein [Alicyclobacillus sp. SO9]